MRLREACRTGTESSRARVAAHCIVVSAAVDMVLGLAQSANAEASSKATAPGPLPIVSSDPAGLIIQARVTPQLGGLPRIDQISVSGMPELYEVSLGGELYDSDAQGYCLIRGELIDNRSQPKLTRERPDQLGASTSTTSCCTTPLWKAAPASGASPSSPTQAVWVAGSSSANCRAQDGSVYTCLSTPIPENA